MAIDKHNTATFAQPVKARELLDQERREFDDCMSCRIVGKSGPLIHSPFTYRHLSFADRQNLYAYRRDRIYRSRGIQLLGGHETAREQPCGNPQKQISKIYRHAWPQGGVVGDVFGTGLDGGLPVIRMIEGHVRELGAKKSEEERRRTEQEEGMYSIPLFRLEDRSSDHEYAA